MRADRSLRRPVSPFLFAWALILGASLSAFGDERSGSWTELQQKARALQLADQRDWHLLLHYHRDLLRRYRSEIDDRSFFLSSRGHVDPSAELDATLQAFFDPPAVSTDTEHPQCRYPARYAWLKERLAGPDFPAARACPRFEKWRNEMSADSVSIVFASYYLNNPASMYGHTFLLLNSRRHTEKERLLDYAVNFAAYPENNNAVLYVLEGLTGGHPGKFSSMPYYMKVQEYNNLESRDLWEYSLAMDAASVQRLVEHLWEMGHASMAYYFLNKNCSYQLLPAMEAAQPALHLSDSYWFKAIPADTLRSVIRQPDFLTGLRLRPSHASRMLAARKDLSAEEIRVVEHLAKKAAPADLGQLQPFSKERQARILDSAHDLFRYRIGFARRQPSEVLEQEQALLLARSQLQITTPRIELTTGTTVAPDRGHPTGKVGISFGASRRSTFEEVSLRAALHDQEDDPTGFVRGSQLEMFKLQLRFDNEETVPYIQDLTLIDIMSLSPWDRWIRKPSWKLHTGLSVATDTGHDPENSLYYGLDLGSGFSVQSSVLRHELWYGLAVADAGAGQVFEGDYRLGGGAEGGVVVEAARWWRLHFNAGWLRHPLGHVGSTVRLRLIQAFPLGKLTQFRILLERQNTYKEVVWTLQRHF